MDGHRSQTSLGCDATVTRGTPHPDLGIAPSGPTDGPVHDRPMLLAEAPMIDPDVVITLLVLVALAALAAVVVLAMFIGSVAAAGMRVGLDPRRTAEPRRVRRWSRPGGCCGGPRADRRGAGPGARRARAHRRRGGRMAARAIPSAGPPPSADRVGRRRQPASMMAPGPSSTRISDTRLVSASTP